MTAIKLYSSKKGIAKNNKFKKVLLEFSRTKLATKIRQRRPNEQRRSSRTPTSWRRPTVRPGGRSPRCRHGRCREIGTSCRVGWPSQRVALTRNETFYTMKLLNFNECFSPLINKNNCASIFIISSITRKNIKLYQRKGTKKSETFNFC